MFFEDFWRHRNNCNFDVKYLPLPESFNTNLIPLNNYISIILLLKTIKNILSWMPLKSATVTYFIGNTKRNIFFFLSPISTLEGWKSGSKRGLRSGSLLCCCPFSNQRHSTLRKQLSLAEARHSEKSKRQSN